MLCLFTLCLLFVFVTGIRICLVEREQPLRGSPEGNLPNTPCQAVKWKYQLSQMELYWVGITGELHLNGEASYLKMHVVLNCINSWELLQYYRKTIVQWKYHGQEFMNSFNAGSMM